MLVSPRIHSHVEGDRALSNLEHRGIYYLIDDQEAYSEAESDVFSTHYPPTASTVMFGIPRSNRNSDKVNNHGLWYALAL